MSLNVIAFLRATAGSEGDMAAAVDAMVEPSRAESGCVSYRPLRDLEHPDRFVVVEEWVDDDALTEHFGTVHFKRFEESIGTLLAEPPEIRRVGPTG
jgi:quinol monooxygenase YgiN